VLQSYTEPRRGEMIVAQLFPLTSKPRRGGIKEEAAEEVIGIM